MKCLNSRFLFILTASLVIGSASGLLYNIENVDIIAFPNETLQYRIIITNNESMAHQIYINKIFIDNTFTGQYVDVQPSINIRLNPGESKMVNISIPVSDELAMGVYRTLYTTKLFVSYGNNTDTILLDAVILSRAIEPLEIQNITIIGPGSIDPRLANNFTITLLCNSDSISPIISLVISNDSSVVYQSSSVKDLSYGINVFDTAVKLPDRTSPGDYQLVVGAELAGVVISQGSIALVVKPYDMINYEVVTSEDLFGKRVYKFISNDGTEPATVNVNYTASVLEPLLISNAVLTIKEGDAIVSSRSLSFVDYLISNEVNLLPGQAVELIVDFNYGLLLLVPFVVILSVIGWVLLTRRVRVDKEILACTKEGGDIMVKVGISVKNVSFKSIHEVKIVEDLPVFAKAAGGFGSIKGDVDRKKGVINFWVGRLDSKEEVLISYKFKTDMELLGRVSLPPVTIKYRTKGGKITTVKSGTPTIQLVKPAQ